MTDTADTLTICVYSDDRTVREQVRLALGRRVARDLPPIEVVDVATAPALMTAADAGGIDLFILDGESTPAGGMGMCHQIKDLIADAPPIMVLVARVADSWIATWSRADAVSAYPIDPVRLPGVVADLIRAKVLPAEVV